MSIKDTLYYQYIREREGSEVIECEDGFLVYCENERSLFIKDTFVKPEARKSGAARYLVSTLEELAREKQKEWIFAHVQMNDPGRHDTLIAAFRIGFELVESGVVFLVIAKRVLN
jgi:predicted GNAT family acetyltransferase